MEYTVRKTFERNCCVSLNRKTLKRNNKDTCMHVLAHGVACTSKSKMFNLFDVF